MLSCCPDYELAHLDKLLFKNGQGRKAKALQPNNVFPLSESLRKPTSIKCVIL